jgi:hypothetical protein
MRRHLFAKAYYTTEKQWSALKTSTPSHVTPAQNSKNPTSKYSNLLPTDHYQAYTAKFKKKDTILHLCISLVRLRICS